jgi:two-component system, NtrC family, response regulator HupR/HoxA
MKPSGTVLILSRATAEWRAGVAALTAHQSGYRVVQVKTEAGALTTLADVHVDVAIVDHSDAGEDGLAFLGQLQDTYPDIVRLLVLGAKANLGKAIGEAGVYQFLRKPLDANQLALLVQRGLETRELARRQRLLARELALSGDWLEFGSKPGQALPGERRNFEKLVYISETMAGLCQLALQAAHTDVPVLIQGETGTGKELLARALHFQSPRRTGPLVMQNCAAVADGLLETELFGHANGTLSGAASERVGLLSAADGGTIFLDEISELPKALQLSLLRFLQTGQVTPVGSERAESCSVRVIAASTRPLKAAVADGTFRQDLYFRLRGFELELPPLRERPEDVPVLAEFFTAKHSQATGRKILGISANALEKLAAYDFPGNVRELENEIRRMVALAKDDSYLTTSMMSPTLLAAAARKSFGIEAGFAPAGNTLKEKIESLEKHVVQGALARHKWNRSRVAEELGLSRVGLANKIRRYGLNDQQNGS